MSGETFKDSTVVALLNDHFNMCEIDIEADSQYVHFDSTLNGQGMALAYRVRGIPHMMILNAQADTLGSIRGFYNFETFTTILENIIENN